MRREGWSEVVLRVQEGLNTRLVKPLGSTPFDLFFARSPEMRREGRGEVEVSESELENVVRIGDRNEVMVKVVYPEVVERVKKVREEVCKSKNRKRKKGKQFKEGDKVMVRVERQCKQDLFFKGLFVVRGFVEKKAFSCSSTGLKQEFQHSSFMPSSQVQIASDPTAPSSRSQVQIPPKS